MKKHLVTPSRRKRARRQGFRARMRSRGGRRTFARRRRKGRWQLLNA